MCSKSKNSTHNGHPHSIQSGENLKAEICRCGTVQLHLGPLTLRYTRAAFDDLHQLVTKIKERLEVLESGKVVRNENSFELSKDFALSSGKKVVGEA